MLISINKSILTKKKLVFINITNTLINNRILFILNNY